MPHKEMTMNVALLEKIAETIVDNCGDFDMGNWHCGTVHCIGGWAEVLTGNEKSYSAAKKAKILGLNVDESDRLFSLFDWPVTFRNAYRNAKRDMSAKAQIAADRIRHFIATEGRE